ncbi:MAG: carboxyltransferase domain-containing protein [Deltaproteobacteria bacterium]|nr:carboxyltransferase domain-containing protein [Deltaproteobacteria bacterium]MBW2339326.1 carboxyltransferase domain-containing protein [Deltaproteobacteria bacterium]
MFYQSPHYRIMGDRSVLVELGDEISPEIHRRVRQFAIALVEHPTEGLMEIIPTYGSLLIIYDPLKISIATLQYRVEDLQKQIKEIQIPEPKIVEIPVV